MESSILDTPADSPTEKVADTLLDCQEADLYTNYNSSEEDSFIPMIYNKKKKETKNDAYERVNHKEAKDI